MINTTMRWTAVAALVALSAVACSSTDTKDDSDGGTGGSAGSAGSAGAGGSAGSEGGTGGSAGSAGSEGGTGGSAGSDAGEIDAPVEAGGDCLTCVQTTCAAEFAACQAVAACIAAAPDALTCAQMPPDGGTIEDCATAFVTAAAADMGGAEAANDLITCLLGGDGGTGCAAACGAAGN